MICYGDFADFTTAASMSTILSRFGLSLWGCHRRVAETHRESSHNLMREAGWLVVAGRFGVVTHQFFQKLRRFRENLLISKAEWQWNQALGRTVKISVSTQAAADSRQEIPQSRQEVLESRQARVESRQERVEPRQPRSRWVPPRALTPMSLSWRSTRLSIKASKFSFSILSSGSSILDALNP